MPSFTPLAMPRAGRCFANSRTASGTVGQLAESFAISLAAASKHIKALENAGLIRREVRGRTHLCRLDPGPLARAHQWLDRAPKGRNETGVWLRRPDEYNKG